MPKREVRVPWIELSARIPQKENEGMPHERHLPKGPKSTPTDVIAYEIRMWRGSYAAIKPRWEAFLNTRSDDELFEYNLRIEGFLLHTRNLLAFFTDKHNKDTDLKITQPSWAGAFEDRTILEKLINRANAVDKAHHGDNEGDTCYNEISKFLSHCADQRYLRPKSWETDGLFSDLNPIFSDFEATFIGVALPPTEVHVTPGVANSTASFRR